MKESEDMPKWLMLLTSKSLAFLASFALTLGGVISWLLQGQLSKSDILKAATGLVGLLSASIWLAAIATTRLRAKISKLENEILSLQSRPSAVLKDATPSDRVLVAVYGSNRDDSGIAKSTKLSQAMVDTCLHELVGQKMLRRIMQPWQKTHHVVTPQGRKYLLDNHFIE